MSISVVRTHHPEKRNRKLDETYLAIHQAPHELRPRAEELYERFTAEGLSSLPWLTCICELTRRSSGKCRCSGEWSHIRTPADDHPRGFINRRTRERVLTVHPYFSDRRSDGEIWGFDDTPTGEPVIFPRHTADEQKALTIPEFTVYCQEFAAKHGLTVKVSFDSWYYPGHTLLIEYRKTDKEVTCNSQNDNE